MKIKTKEEIKERVPGMIKSTKIYWEISLIILAVAIPLILAHNQQNQLINGVIINGLLFWAVLKVGIEGTLPVAFLPSSIALFRGLLPPTMAILLPWIIFSNLILILVFYKFYKKTLWGGMILASWSKFLFLFFLSSFFAEKIALSSLKMLQFPQLFTALGGGTLALLIYQIVCESKK